MPAPPFQASALWPEPNSRRLTVYCMDELAQPPWLVPAANMWPLTWVPLGWFCPFLPPRTCRAMTVPSIEGIKGDGKGSVKALTSRPGTVGNTHTLFWGSPYTSWPVRSSPSEIEPVPPALGAWSLNHTLGYKGFFANQLKAFKKRFSFKKNLWVLTYSSVF